MPCAWGGVCIFIVAGVVMQQQMSRGGHFPRGEESSVSSYPMVDEEPVKQRESDFVVVTSFGTMTGKVE